MKALNLHVDNWSMLDPKSDRDFQSEPQYLATDVISAADDISHANTDPLCELSDREYVH
jgi:hypothetical protein